jgi:hypothetical protein
MLDKDVSSNKCLLEDCPNLVEKPCQLIEAQTNDSDVRVFFCALCGKVTRIDMDEITQKPNHNISGLFTMFVGSILVVWGLAITFSCFFPAPNAYPSLHRLELPTNK